MQKTSFEKEVFRTFQETHCKEKTGLECFRACFLVVKIGTSSTIRFADGPPSPKGKVSTPLVCGNHLYALRGKKKPDS